jgi:hypothetical protein
VSLALREAYTARAQTFKQQLELERIGESDSMMKMLGEYMQSLKLGQVDIWVSRGSCSESMHGGRWEDPATTT